MSDHLIYAMIMLGIAYLCGQAADNATEPSARVCGRIQQVCLTLFGLIELFKGIIE